MRRKLLILLAVSLLSATLARAQHNRGVLGLWREPGGSVIDVHPCGSELCARLAYITPGAPSQFDSNNPNSAQRSRRLCGLQIGWGFHSQDPNRAIDGYIYDPRSGSSYHGSLTAEGDSLRLRGWVGFKIFGRTETWRRLDQPPPPCRA